MKPDTAPTSPRHNRNRRHLASVLVALAALIALVAPACGGSSNPAGGLAMEEACKQNSDCASGLICALGSCRAMCATAADCQTGGSCIDNGNVAVCQYAAEKNTACDKPSDCKAPLACASDYRCRNLCTSTADCNVLGITGRVCAKDANGVYYCADPPEVSQGTIVAPPPPGAPDSGVIEPSLDASTSSDGSSSTSDAATGDSSTSDAATGDATTSVDGSPSSGDAGGNMSTDSSAVCSPVCGVGYQCVGGTCTACGNTAGSPCCGSVCGANLTCSNGTCACGNPGQPCCGGTSCQNSVSCVSGVCACGGAGQACCPAGAEAGSVCTASLACAGTKCTCLVAAHQNIVQRSDGSLWYYGGTPTPVTRADASLFIATSFSSSYNTDCGVQNDGTLWCWNQSGTANSYGALGNGTAMGSTIPSQVVTGTGGPALTGITKVFGDDYGYTGCAINASGSLWCWGYGINGVLGNGFTNNSQFAVPVLTSSGGPQFTGVASVSISQDHACAVTTGGALYCWGNNTNGQLGVGTPTASYLFPTQVTALFNNVVEVSVGYNGTTCASTNDGAVWCWGTNSYGTLGNGLTSGMAIVPTRVLVAADAGAPFSGVSQVELLSTGQKAVARKASDGSLWVWGSTAPYVPVPYTEGGFPVTSTYLLTDSMEYGNPQFIASDGTFHWQGTAATSPACP